MLGQRLRHRLAILAIVLVAAVSTLTVLGTREAAAAHLQPRHLATILLGTYQRAWALDINHATGRLYVLTNYYPSAGKLIVVDLSTDTVLQSADVTAYGLGLAVEEGHNRVFIADATGNRVLVYNSATLALATTLTLGAGARGIDVDEVHGLLYVTEGTSPSGPGNVAVFDLGTLALLGRVSVARDPFWLAADPVSGRAYVHTAEGIDVIDGPSRTFLGSVPGTQGLRDVVVAPSGLVYAGNADGIVVIDGGARTVLRTIGGFNASLSVTFNTANGLLYATGYESSGSIGALHAIDVTTDTRLASVYFLGGNDAAVNPASDKVYVSSVSSGDAAIAVIGDRATNAAPVANAGPDQTVAGSHWCCQEYVLLSSDGSSDADGDGLIYRWRQVGGPNVDLADSPFPSFTAPSFSMPTEPDIVLTFELVADDGLLQSAPDTVTITVANQRPFAVPGGPYSGVDGTAIQFDGTASVDPQGMPLSYYWYFGDRNGSTSTQPSPSFTYSQTGSFTVCLYVTDDTGLYSTECTTATVAALPPAVSASPDGSVAPGTPVTVTGTWTKLVSGRDPTYNWTWDLDGDGLVDDSGTTAISAEVTRTTSFAAPGVYTLTFAVEKFGYSSSATLVITVASPPVCDAAVADLSVLWPPNHRMAPISILGVTDPDGDPVTVTATYVSQDEVVLDQGQGAGSTSPDASLSPLAVRAERNGNPETSGDGRVYHISFTATDPAGASCSGVVNVCVPHDQRPGGGCVDGGPLYSSIP